MGLDFNNLNVTSVTEVNSDYRSVTVLQETKEPDSCDIFTT